MHNHLLIKIVFALCVILCAITSVSQAQEEDLEYSYGVVASISSKQIVASEYDYETDKEIEVAYEIDKDVVLNNVNSMENISVGDGIEIEYIVKDNKKIAKIITLEKKETISPEEERGEETEEYVPYETSPAEEPAAPAEEPAAEEEEY